MLYSPSMKAFYSELVEYPNPPEDLIPVTDEFHAEFMAARGDAKISVTANGRLSLVVPEAPEYSELDRLKDQRVNQLRREYLRAIDSLSFTNKAGAEAIFGNTPLDRINVNEAIAQGEKTWKPIAVWLDVGGRPVAPFTFADLKALSDAMATAPEPDYVALMGRVSKVMSAKTAEELDAI